MRYETEIGCWSRQWSPEGGFFWNVRQGTFDPNAFHRALGKLSAMSVAEDAVLPRRLVSLLWFIPVFMEWQVERVREAGGDVSAYEQAVTSMTNEVERLLGVP